MSAFFIADLHLSLNTPSITNSFFLFLKKLKKDDELYILGDLFEYYVSFNNNNPLFQQIKDIVHELDSKNIKTYFIHGNRDFLLSKKDSKIFGFELLKDITVLNKFGKKILLVHGDELCEEKLSYKIYRAINRSSFLQTIFKFITTENFKSKLANRLRLNSKINFKLKNNTKVYISLDKTYKYARKYNCDYVIHGHTHNSEFQKYKNISILDTGDWTQKYYTYIEINENYVEIKKSLL
ncbi:MAG: UDP-2,3-diacylglucosamine diphosphatase [Succinivibrionaceae bacterium]